MYKIMNNIYVTMMENKITMERPCYFINEDSNMSEEQWINFANLITRLSNKFNNTVWDTYYNYDISEGIATYNLKVRRKADGKLIEEFRYAIVISEADANRAADEYADYIEGIRDDYFSPTNHWEVFHDWLKWMDKEVYIEGCYWYPMDPLQYNHAFRTFEGYEEQLDNIGRERVVQQFIEECRRTGKYDNVIKEANFITKEVYKMEDENGNVIIEDRVYLDEPYWEFTFTEIINRVVEDRHTGEEINYDIKGFTYDGNHISFIYA